MSVRPRFSHALTLCLMLFLSQTHVDAGVIPWVYDAVFGYHGPAFPAGGGWGSGWGGMPWGGGYRGMWGGYPSGGYAPRGFSNPGFYGSYYGPGYGGYSPWAYGSAMNSCGTGCSTYGASYYPVGPCMGGCSSGCSGTYLSSSGCSPCGVQSQYSPPPADTGQGQPTPAGKTTPPADGFVPVQPRDNDTVLPTENAPDWTAPITPGTDPVPGKALKPEGESPVVPDDDEIVVPPESGTGFPAPQAQPVDSAPPVASTIAPVRRRTSFVTGFRIPTVARVAVTPARQSAETHLAKSDH